MKLTTRKASMRVSDFPEGTLFSVPLDDGRFALGLISRRQATRRTFIRLLADLFGPFTGLDRVPDYPLSRETARASLICSALSLLDGRWRVLGRLEPWRREGWPTPDYHRYEEHTRRHLRVIYDDDHPFHVVAETQMADSGGLQMSASWGSRAAEIHLSMILADAPSLDRLN